jgi:hypothetical protein
MPRYDTNLSRMGEFSAVRILQLNEQLQLLGLNFFTYFWNVQPDDGYLVQPKRVAF